jgi:hypothetical protein
MSVSEDRDGAAEGEELPDRPAPSVPQESETRDRLQMLMADFPPSVHPVLAAALAALPPAFHAWVCVHLLPHPAQPMSTDERIDRVRTLLRESSEQTDMPYTAFSTMRDQALYLWTLSHLRIVHDRLDETEQAQLRLELLCFLDEGLMELSHFDGPGGGPGGMNQDEKSSLYSFLLQMLVALRHQGFEAQHPACEAICRDSMDLHIYNVDGASVLEHTNFKKHAQDAVLEMVRRFPDLGPEARGVLSEDEWNDAVARGSEVSAELSDTIHGSTEPDMVDERAAREAQLRIVHELRGALEPRTEEEKRAWDDPADVLCEQFAHAEAVCVTPCTGTFHSAAGTLPNTWQWQLHLLERVGEHAKHWGIGAHRLQEYVYPLQEELHATREIDERLMASVIAYLQSDTNHHLRAWLGFTGRLRSAEAENCLDFLTHMQRKKKEARAQWALLDAPSEEGGIPTEDFLAVPGKKFLFASSSVRRAVSLGDIPAYHCTQYHAQPDYRHSETSPLNVLGAIAHAGHLISAKRPFGLYQTSGMVLRQNPRFMRYCNDADTLLNQCIQISLHSGASLFSEPYHLAVVTAEDDTQEEDLPPEPDTSDEHAPKDAVTV